MRLLNGLLSLLTLLVLLFTLVSAGYFWIIKGDTLEAIMYMTVAIFLELSSFLDKKKNID